MANKYANLVGTNKIKDEYTKINTGFDGVETDIKAVNTRVDTIITTPIEGAAAVQEIVDARVSAVKEKTFATLDARFEETEQDIATHKADNANPHPIYAKRQYENWIAATLQSGWTSSLGLLYTKNDSGLLLIRGQIIAGTITDGTVIAVLPSGYRPLTSTVLDTYDVVIPTIRNCLVINPDGGIVIQKPNGLISDSTVRINAIVSLV